ncbi:MAG: YfaP family protein [Crocinitomicaceae bacterium]
MSTLLNNPVDCKEDQEINKILRRIDRELESCCNCNVVEAEIDSLERDDALDSLRDSLDACEGEITITLAWKTNDDLDLRLVEPDGTVVYFGKPNSPNGARLDIDMNADGPESSDPIENICYTRTPPAGTYKVIVHYFQRRTSTPEIPYTVYVRNGSSEKYFRGVHTTEKEKHLVYEFTYPE